MNVFCNFSWFYKWTHTYTRKRCLLSLRLAVSFVCSSHLPIVILLGISLYLKYDHSVLKILIIVLASVKKNILIINNKLPSYVKRVSSNGSTALVPGPALFRDCSVYKIMNIITKFFAH